MSNRPNILLITADQWRGDCLGHVGHETVRTPNLDALAAEGTGFLNHYAACAPCSPARASLYTGLYQMNHRVVANGAPLDARFDNIAKLARRAGYEPTLFGYTDTTHDPRGLDPADPILKGYEQPLPGMNVHTLLAEDDATWKSWMRKRGASEAFLAHPHKVEPEEGQAISMRPPAYSAEETQTAFLVEEFGHWLGEQAEGAGWFAHVSFLRPHPPFVVPEPYASMFDPDEVEAPIAINPQGPSGNNPLVLGTRMLSPGNAFQPDLAGSVADLGEEDFRRLRAIYYGMMAEVDAQMGRLIGDLKARGEWENTILIFTSDHGEMMGDHGLLGKGGFYAESQHIPLIITGPGIKAGAVVERFTSSVDIFATLAEVMGVEMRHAPDGPSLVPFLRGEAPARWRDAALWEFDFRHNIGPNERTALGLEAEQCNILVRRNTRAQYVQSAAFPALLFDLEADPEAREDVARAQPDLRLEMAEALLVERMALNDDTLANIMLAETITSD